jgi:cell division protein FtsI (penicillin-binding protein 3)
MSLLARPYEDLWGPRRARMIAVVLAVVFTIIVGRAAYVAFNGPDEAAGPPIAADLARRADIVDRNGQLLATTVQGWSLAADPSAIWDAKEVVAGLRTALPNLNAAALTELLSNRKRKFVWVQRGLTERERKAVKDLGLEGLRFVEEPQRVYPNGKLAGHFLGYTSVDGDGLEGVEKIYDKQLRAGGDALKLTIDASVQYVLEDELEKAQEDFTMLGAVGIVVDARTGAVRALASWPGMDPRRRGEPGVKPNPALNARMELGSIYKPLMVAAALEDGVLTTRDLFNVSAPVKIGATLVRDPHPLPHANAVTASDIIINSSNIGAALIAQRLGAQKQKAFLASVRLLGGHPAEGPQTASPLTPSEWDATAMATVAYGHGISVSPMDFAMTYTPFANGGKYVSANYLEADTAKAESVAVMSSQTAATVLAMLRRTVTEGSGKNADAPGYEVAGKTGTAEKPTPDGYDPNRNITSFAAVFPASRPQYVVLIVLDEAQPRTGEQRTAAVTAATIAGKVVARAAPVLDVQPVLTAAPAVVMQAQTEADAQ